MAKSATSKALVALRGLIYWLIVLLSGINTGLLCYVALRYVAALPQVGLQDGARPSRLTELLPAASVVLPILLAALVSGVIWRWLLKPPKLKISVYQIEPSREKERQPR